MLGPRLLLLVCLGVGLGAVWFAAAAQVRDQRRRLLEAAERDVRADLRERGRALAKDLAAALESGPPEAVFDAQGRLLRPKPPATVRPFAAPVGTLATHYLGTRDYDQARAHANTSAERALVALREGTARKDPARLADALNEPALAGTELAYRLRLEIFRLRGEAPDAAWVDDVSALLAGPSDRFARTLLAAADARPNLDPAARAALTALRPRPGIRIHGDLVDRVAAAADGRLALRRTARPDPGTGPLAEPLPEPYDALEVRGAVTTPVRDERWKVGGLYGLAALILVVGTVYAYIAIGRAHRLAQAKVDFVANVTHELKTPLANIRLYTESLKDGRVRPDDHAEFLDTILDETGRLDGLVEGLLHAARGPRLARAPVDLDALVAETEARWRPRLEREGFVFTVDAGPLSTITGDKEALLRALGNLLDNARKYGRRDKRVALNAAAHNGHARLTVRDHGPGIPVGARARVRAPFTRLESADRKETEGTGLGLSLVVSCLEAHGGRLEIDGADGAGAAVTMVLPLETT